VHIVNRPGINRECHRRRHRQAAAHLPLTRKRIKDTIDA
jgi:hypothetical protein